MYCPRHNFLKKYNFPYILVSLEYFPKPAELVEVQGL